MGSIRKRNDRYQAQVRREGVTPVSKTFQSKRDAEAWIRGIEARIDAGEVNITTPKLLTLRDLLNRYSQEVTPFKKGQLQEQGRIRRLLNDPISDCRLVTLSPMLIAHFRDRRIKDGVRAAQIDLILIRHCIKIARIEWGVTIQSNPVDGVRIPNGVKRRERRLQTGEFELLQEAAAQCINTLIWPCVEFAIETGMRRSEILSILWRNVDLDRRIVLLPDTKNGHKREVPLTQRATAIIKETTPIDERVFPTTDYSIRHGWDRLIRRAGISNLRFHDLRHEAISRFFELGLSVPEVAAISGHKDPRMLFRYTHLNAETISVKLDRV
jgi:integrase